MRLDSALLTELGGTVLLETGYRLLLQTAGEIGTDSILCFDTHLKAWSVWDGMDVASMWLIRDPFTGEEQVLAGGRRGSIWLLNSPTVERPYVATVRHTSVLGEQGSDKSPRHLYLYFKESGAFTVEVTTYLDFSPVPTQELEVSLLGGTGLTLGLTWVLGEGTLGAQKQIIKRLNLHGVGEFLTIEARNRLEGQTFTWLGYEVLWRSRRIVRRA